MSKKRSDKEKEEAELLEYQRQRSTRYKIYAVAAVVVIVLAVAAVAAVLYINHSKRQETLVFAYQDRIADAASIIAIEKGYFEDEGLNIDGIKFSSGPACTQALITRTADIATMGDTTAITTMATQGDDFSILCTHGGGEDRHRMIVSDESGIDNISDLEGKRIAVKQGTSTHGGLMLFADHYGLDLNDELVEMKPSEMVLALESGAIDAFVASEPNPSQAEARGAGHELATLGGMNNTYPILIVADNGFLGEHPDWAEKFIRALKKATDFIQQNHNESVQILSDVSGLEKDIIETAMANHYYDVNANQQTKDSLTDMSGFLYDIGKISTKPDFDKCIDREYMEKAGV